MCQFNVMILQWLIVHLNPSCKEIQLDSIQSQIGSPLLHYKQSTINEPRSLAKDIFLVCWIFKVDNVETLLSVYYSNAASKSPSRVQNGLHSSYKETNSVKKISHQTLPPESSIPLQGISFYLNDRPPAKYGIGKDVIIVKLLCVTHFFIILPSFRVVAITPSNFSVVLTWLYRFRVEVIGLVMLLG